MIYVRLRKDPFRYENDTLTKRQGDVADSMFSSFTETGSMKNVENDETASDQESR